MIEKELDQAQQELTLIDEKINKDAALVSSYKEREKLLERIKMLEQNWFDWHE